MAAKRGHRRKPKPLEEDLPDPGERQRCRFPEQWEQQSKAERQAMEARARQLISGEPIDWGELH